MEKEDQLLRPVIQSRNQAVQRIKESQQQFIFVASLLDRIPNIAGLARTCEVCHRNKSYVPLWYFLSIVDLAFYD